MRYVLTVLFVLGCVAGTGYAQVELSCRVVPGRAILHEPIFVSVRIQNNTSQSMTFSDDKTGQRLWMEIERSPGRTVRQVDPVILGEPVTVPPMEAVTRRINIVRSYDLRGEGPYTVRARADWNQRSFVSSPSFVDVVPGLELMRATGMVSDDGGDRLYRLMTVNRDRGEQIFLRIDDERANVCYAVVPLGRLLRVRPPMLRVDGNGHITVLHQTSPARFLYHVFTPSGEQVTRRVYTSEEPGVDLAVGPGGRWIVTGATSSLMDGD